MVDDRNGGRSSGVRVHQGGTKGGLWCAISLTKASKRFVAMCAVDQFELNAPKKLVFETVSVDAAYEGEVGRSGAEGGCCGAEGWGR